MRPLRVGIIGGGHLGRIHTRILKSNSTIDLVGVVDPSSEARAQITRDLDLPVCDDYRNLRDRIDAAIIATPTALHYEIGIDLLNRGIDTLIEKPLCQTLQQADHLIHTADQQQAVLQVGHVERFNPAFEQAVRQLSAPRYIEAQRMSRYTFRSTDIGVVSDLMIHDIDLVASVVASPLLEVRAVGICVFGPQEDIAQARLEFANGTVANLTASRCSFQSMRKMSWISEQGFVSADLSEGTLCRISCPEWLATGPRDIHQLPVSTQQDIGTALFDKIFPLDEIRVEPQNAIEREQHDFFDAIRSARLPRVTGRHGRQAMSIAEAILDSIRSHRWSDGYATRIGPQAEKINLLGNYATASKRRAG